MPNDRETAGKFRSAVVISYAAESAAVSAELSPLEEDALSGGGEDNFSGIPAACATIGSDKMRENLEVGTRSTPRRLSSFPPYN